MTDAAELIERNDGVALFSTAHPIAPWWRRLWLFLWHRDISPTALEFIDIDGVELQGARLTIVPHTVLKEPNGSP